MRVSIALLFIGAVGLKLCWTVFYDDFTLICKKRMSHSTGIVAEALFDLFGMWYKRLCQIETQVRTLGLQVKLGAAAKGFATQKRTEMN